MTGLPSKQQLNELKEHKGRHCLSIYLPFIEPTGATNPSLIAFKNALRESENLLGDAGVRPGLLRKMLAPLRKMVEDGTEFWPIRRGALAVFVAPNFFRVYRLPDGNVAPQILVNKAFHVAPLSEVAHEDKAYYVLALSHGHVRLFQGSHYQLRRLRPKNFPVSMKETLGIDEFPKWRETHPVAPAAMGRTQAIHGQYNKRQTDKIMLAEFFHRINNHMGKVLRGSHAPLVIGGVGYLAPLYARVNTYPHLAPQTIKGNLEHVSPEDIRSRAWEIVRD